MNIAAYFIVNILLFFSWYALLFRKKTLLFADRIIGVFVLGLAQIIITEMLLGIVFERLFAIHLFFLNISISSVVLLYAVSTGSGRGMFREGKDEAARIFNMIRGDVVLLFVFTLFIISIGWVLFLGYIFPSYSWDALWYHLPLVGHMLQSGAIEGAPASSFIDITQFATIFPKNIELFFLWNIIFLKSDVIVDLSQLCFSIAGVLAVYSMAVKLGIKEKYALLSALLFFFSPVIILQSTANYVDIATSVLFLIAINFLLYDDLNGYSDRDRDSATALSCKMPLLISGLSTGILLGAKGSGPLFLGILILGIACRDIVRYLGAGYSLYPYDLDVFKKSIKGYLIYFIVPVFLLGGYWYIRNWALYNNPVYPIEVAIGGVTLFKGLYNVIIDTASELAVIKDMSMPAQLFYVWLEKVGYYFYDSRLSGFGPVWFILFLPGIFAAFIYALAKKKYDFLFVAIVLLAAFLMYPNNWNTRYVLFITGLGALSFGLVLECFSKRENILKITGLALALYVFLTANSPCITPGKVREFIALPADERTLANHKPFNIDTHVRDHYGYWIWIDKNIKQGDTVAYPFISSVLDVSEPFFVAPLWNREFSNKVVYIKSDSYNEWIKALEQNNVTHALIKQRSAEDKWIKFTGSYGMFGIVQEKFQVVYADENYKIVKLNRPKTGS